MAESDEKGSMALKELARLFLRLGFTAFGGPAAHIAMMEDEVVRRRCWLTRQEFLDLLGAANLIPGPSSTELAIYIGYRKRGVPGLLVAGCCFILPAAVIVGVIAWAYVRFGHLPALQGILYGIKPVVIAIVVQALWRLGRTAVKTPLLAAVGIGAAILSAVSATPVAVLFGAGLIVAAIAWVKQGRGQSAVPALAPGVWPMLVSIPFGLWPLFWVFVKIGCVVFGSGYVLLAFLRADLVSRLHWLNEGQLLDAVAVGQVTPGPVFTTATFIGYLLGGSKGAIVATAGIFLPAFVLVAATAPVVRRLRGSPIAGAFLDGLNVASAALMAVVTWQLARAAVVDMTTGAIAAASAALLFALGLNATWLVLGGAVVGIILH